MSTEDPDITFDEQGVCNYCHYADSQANARRLFIDQRPWVINELRKAGRGKNYDCLIGLSGGVDSSIALHYLVENGLRPLTFTVDNGWNTPASDENIMRLVEGLKVPFYRYTLNLEAFRSLQRAFIQSGVANIEIPTDHVLMATTYEMARKYKIKHIVSGGNWQTEGTMPPSYGYQARDLTHITAIARKFNYGKVLLQLPTISLPQYLRYRFLERIKVVNLLDYYNYNREQAQQILEEKYKWKRYGEKHGESVFTKWFQDFYLPQAHNLDKRRPHFSSLIHSGQLTREQASNLLEYKLIWPPSPFPDIKYFVSHPYTEYPTNERWWNLLSSIYGHFKKQD